MRDCYAGERAIKDKGVIYLPPTPAMAYDGMHTGQDGLRAYNVYKERGIFHDIVREGVEAFLGLITLNDAVIKLPKELEPMRNNASVEGESLLAFLRRIYTEQLITGRGGILADFPKDAAPTALPYLTLYSGESITNWSETTSDALNQKRLNLVILDESGYEMNPADFGWTYTKKYRILVLGDPNINEFTGEVSPNIVYRSELRRLDTNSGDLVTADLATPSFRGKPAADIPFTFFNSKDLVADPDTPPLLGLARLSLAIYRGECDYRQNLFMQGQETLVVSGLPEQDAERQVRVGAGALLELPVGADAKYVGVSAAGLSEQRQTLQNDMSRAALKAGQFLNNRQKTAESGDALSIRMSAQTATLGQISFSGAKALEAALKSVARWIGANADEVEVIPNMTFHAEAPIQTRDLVDLMTAKNLGLPLSLQSIHDYAADNDLTTMDFETELAVIEDESATAAIPRTGTRGAPGLPTGSTGGAPVQPVNGGQTNGE